MRWLLAACLALCLAPLHAQERLTVFAAASLKNALDEVNRGFPGRVTAAYSSSSALARQIEAGAPAQVFISADSEWMDYIEKKGLLAPGSRRNVLGNRLVWIVPTGTSVGADPLAVLKPTDRLALADPQHVPAGKYAKAALTKLGVWDKVAGRVAAAENVRAALALVARREAPLGIVYETDARAEPNVTVARAIDPSLHPAIVYPAAATRSAPPLAAEYLNYLSAPAAEAVFRKHGFSRP
jgi:molybdate transport system substrate-binding protein